MTRLALIAVIAWFLFLPLRDVFQYPQRLSVLPNLETDAAAYDAFARDFAASWKLSALPSKHPPGWMVVLAAVYASVGHSYVAGKLVSWVALVLTVPLCARLATRVFGTRSAVIAAVLCASSPGLRAYVGTLQYEVLTGALFTLFLVAAVNVLNGHSRLVIFKRAALAGLVGTALVLTRETFVLVVPVVTLWMWLRLRGVTHGRTSAIAAAITLAVAAVPAIAWSVAQSIHYERVILVSEKGPKEFQLGNNPLANGTYNEPLAGMAEPAGIAFVRAQPLRALELAGRKALYMFGVLRDGWNVPHPPAIWLWRATTGAAPYRVIAPFVRGGWLLVACVAAIFVMGREGLKRWWVVPACVAAIIAPHVVTLGSYRFAVPLLPILYVLASGPIALLLQATMRALRTPIAAVAFGLLVVLAVLAQFRAWPLHMTYNAVDLEGISAANVIDVLSGTPARAGDARRGVRPIALLPEEYLPRGSVTVSVGLRRTGVAPHDLQPLSRIALVSLDGQPACAHDVAASDLPSDRFENISVECRLEADGPATLAIFSLGVADLSIDAVHMRWH